MAVQGQVRDALAALLSDDFAGLPAAEIHVSPIYPNRIELTLHEMSSTFGDFEAWREALRIPASAVDTRTWDHTLCLQAEGALLGSTVVLTAYGPLLPVAAPEAVRAA